MYEPSLFDFQEAVRRLKLGNNMIRRKAWPAGSYLSNRLNYVTKEYEYQIFDGNYWAYWDLTKEDTFALDWYDLGE